MKSRAGSTIRQSEIAADAEERRNRAPHDLPLSETTGQRRMLPIAGVEVRFM